MEGSDRICYHTLAPTSVVEPWLSYYIPIVSPNDL